MLFSSLSNEYNSQKSDINTENKKTFWESVVISTHPVCVMVKFPLIFSRLLEVDHPDRGPGLVTHEQQGAPDELVRWEETRLSTQGLDLPQSLYVLDL